MRSAALRGMLRAEAAASDWFARLTRREQQVYLRAHPRSKFALLAPAPRARTAAPPRPRAAPRAAPRQRARAADFDTGSVSCNEDVAEVLPLWNSMMRRTPENLQSALMRGTDLRPRSYLDTQHGGRLALELNGLDADGNEVIHAQRSFHRVGGKLVAHHDELRVAKNAQAHGVAKHLLRNSVREYRAMGVHRVETEANIDVGGYAWAKYGFAPHSEEWTKLRNRLRARHRELRRHLDPETDAHLAELLKSDDPKTIWDVADLQAPVRAKTLRSRGPEEHALGKQMLLGQSWDGALHLHDAASMRRFRRYVS